MIDLITIHNQTNKHFFQSGNNDVVTDIDDNFTALSNAISQKSVITVSTIAGADYVCDGIADNVEIQAAIDAVFAVGGGIVFIKAGIYFLSSYLTIKANVLVVGEGKATILKQTNSVNIDKLIRGTSCHYAGLLNLQVDYNHNNNSACVQGMAIATSSYFRIENCLFQNAKGFAIGLIGDNVSRNDHALIVNNRIINPLTNPNDMLLVVSDYGRVINNFVSGCNANISLVAYESDYMLVQGNVIQLASGSSHTGIAALSLRYSSILDNHIIGAGNGYGIACYTEHDNPSPIVSYGNRIDGNVISNVTNAFQFIQTSYDELTNNKVYTANYAIEFSSSIYSLVNTLYIRNNRFINITSAVVNNGAGVIRWWSSNNIGFENLISVVSSGATYNVNRNLDNTIVVNKSTGSATTVNLPDGTEVEPGKIFIIKDGKGDAATNNITLDGAGSQTIDGALTNVINANYGQRRIQWNGTEWNVI